MWEWVLLKCISPNRTTVGLKQRRSHGERIRRGRPNRTTVGLKPIMASVPSSSSYGPNRTTVGLKRRVGHMRRLIRSES